MKIDIQILNDSSFKFLPKKKVVKSLFYVFKHETRKVDVLVNVIYVSDKAIHEMNKRFLNHDRTTDVITFSLGESEKKIEGEIYISIDTAKKQAKAYYVSLSNEIIRLAIHGALHLAGYKDDTDEKRMLMHNLENKYLEMN